MRMVVLGGTLLLGAIPVSAERQCDHQDAAKLLIDEPIPARPRSCRD